MFRILALFGHQLVCKVSLTFQSDPPVGAVKCSNPLPMRNRAHSIHPTSLTAGLWPIHSLPDYSATVKQPCGRSLPAGRRLMPQSAILSPAPDWPISYSSCALLPSIPTLMPLIGYRRWEAGASRLVCLFSSPRATLELSRSSSIVPHTLSSFIIRTWGKNNTFTTSESLRHFQLEAFLVLNVHIVPFFPLPLRQLVRYDTFPTYPANTPVLLKRESDAHFTAPSACTYPRLHEVRHKYFLGFQPFLLPSKQSISSFITTLKSYPNPPYAMTTSRPCLISTLFSNQNS